MSDEYTVRKEKKSNIKATTSRLQESPRKWMKRNQLSLCTVCSMDTKRASKVSVVQILSISAIAAPVMYSTLAGLNPWIQWLRSSSIACSAWMKATNFFYGLSKSVIYFLFMERLFTVFNGSYLSFGSITKIMVRIFFGMYTATLCILTNVFSGSEFDAITGRCNWDPVRWTYPVMVLSCIVAEVTISIAFSRRLVQLNALKRSNDSMNSIDNPGIQRKSNSFKDADKSSRTWNILLKSSVLTFITLISTPLSIILGFVLGFTGLWVALDCMVCSWMVNRVCICMHVIAAPI